MTYINFWNKERRQDIEHTYSFCALYKQEDEGVYVYWS